MCTNVHIQRIITTFKLSINYNVYTTSIDDSTIANVRLNGFNESTTDVDTKANAHLTHIDPALHQTDALTSRELDAKPKG